jgi:hypothetical protein
VIAGTLLLIAGLASWAFFVQRSNTEPHSYSRGGKPPSSVRLVAGDTYSIAIHGGVDREVQLGLSPSALQCTAALAGQAPGALELVVEQQDTKATDKIASFVSAISGVVQVQCTGIGRVYVDDAADATFDWSGVWLVLASLALAIGVPLMLSALRGPVRSSVRAGGEDDEVQ